MEVNIKKEIENYIPVLNNSSIKEWFLDNNYPLVAEQFYIHNKKQVRKIIKNKFILEFFRIVVFSKQSDDIHNIDFDEIGKIISFITDNYDIEGVDSVKVVFEVYEVHKNDSDAIVYRNEEKVIEKLEEFLEYNPQVFLDYIDDEYGESMYHIFIGSSPFILDYIKDMNTEIYDFYVTRAIYSHMGLTSEYVIYEVVKNNLAEFEEETSVNIDESQKVDLQKISNKLELDLESDDYSILEKQIWKNIAIDDVFDDICKYILKHKSDELLYAVFSIFDEENLIYYISDEE